jgi:hypothetical protein
MPILDLNLTKQNPIVSDEMLLQQKNIKKLSISKEVVKLPLGAFQHFNKLQKVYFEPKSRINKIPEACFNGCSELETIRNLPIGLISIDENAFKNCKKIKEIFIPCSVEYIAESAFDGWTENQTIHLEKRFTLSQKCKAIIIATNDLKFEEDEFINKDGLKKYIVKTKCGHVGRDHYIPINFPILAASAKEAAMIAKNKPRVKRDHLDAILEVKLVSDLDYQNQIEMNRSDPYLCIRSKHQQKEYDDTISERKIKEPKYQKLVNKRKPKKYRKEAMSEKYITAKNKIQKEF